MDIKKVFDYLNNLSVNNNRDWFNSHKDTYLQINAEFEVFVNRIIDNIAKFEELINITAKDCMYRIYRDLRFSPDKRPYKEYLDFYIARGGKKGKYCGYYVHIKQGQTLIGGGIWNPSKEDLYEIRSVIYNDPETYLKIINDKDFSNNFTFWQQKLKTKPKGFPTNMPENIAELIRYTAYVPMHTFTDNEACCENFESELIKMAKLLKPYNDFINEILN